MTLLAAAHDGAVSDAVHAQQDLVGESITKIEQQTAANAAKIKKATGARPGTRQAARASARAEQAQAAASTDPGRSGSWSAVVPTEVVPVFQAVLPNGKVLIWNPADDSYKRADVRGCNIFRGYVQLADGSVLATGGETKAVDDLVDLQNAAFAAERWDPATRAWTTLASASRVRQYHLTASLLPDGRVMTGGGGVCGRCTTKGYLEKNIEYFTPPYLYKSDGSGQLADRPVIGNVPSAIKAGRTFTVTSPQAKAIRKVGLIRLGAPTHGVDQGQRYIPLTATASGTGLTVSAPATAEIAPPGYYMLFLTDSAGVPSVAKIMKVELDTCTGGYNQRWERRSDATIRFATSPSMCLSVVGQVKQDGAPLELASCKYRAGYQAWSNG